MNLIYFIRSKYFVFERYDEIIKEDMMNKFLITLEKGSIRQDEIEKQIDILIDQCKLNDIKKILIIPPDFTRCYSMAGDITQILYHKLSPYCHVDICQLLVLIWQ